MNKGKWTKFKILQKEDKLKRYLPETKKFTEANFWLLMDRHNDVIIKPTYGQQGIGIIRVTGLDNKQYEIHFGENRKRINGKRAVWKKLRNQIWQKDNIVQQRIPLATYRGRPMDIRIMVQRRSGTPWEVTGKLVKVAGSGFIITNTARSRGFVLPLSAVAGKQIANDMDNVSIVAAKTLSQSYKGLRKVGMDLALDKAGRIWIIECNFAPASSLFLRLKDKTMYRRIVSYHKKK